MMKVWKKLVVVLIAMLFFGSLIPSITGGERADWEADISVTGIWLDGLSQPTGSPDAMGYFLNQSYDVYVWVQNTGETALINLNVSCVITNGTDEYFNGWDTTSLMSLAIHEEDYVTFTWTNTMDNMEYDIDVTVTADSFGTQVQNTSSETIMIMNTSSLELDPMYTLNLLSNSVTLEPAYNGNYSYYEHYYHAGHTVIPMAYELELVVYNTGNNLWVNPVDVVASIFDAPLPGGVPHWINETTINTQILPGQFAIATFALPIPAFAAPGMKSMNVSLDATNVTDSAPVIFTVGDVRNVGIAGFLDYDDAGDYETQVDLIQIGLMNDGNVNLTGMADFDATITIEDTNGGSQLNTIYNIWTANLTDPQSSFIISYPFNTQLPEGMYYFNVSINPIGEYNNTNANDNSISIMINIVDNYMYTYEIISPLSGQYYDTDIIPIAVEIWNTGTVTTFSNGFHLNVSYKNMDTMEEWVNYTGDEETAGQVELLPGEGIEIEFDTWANMFKYNADFELTVTLSENLGTIDDTDTVEISIRGGPANGTLKGKVTDMSDVALEGISVGIFDPISDVMIDGMKTDAQGEYEFELPGTSAGIAYKINATSYWYSYAVIDEVKVMSNRISVAPTIKLEAKETGRVNGTVLLMAGMDAPDLEEDVDYTDVEVMVDGMPDSFATDDDGFFDQLVVAGTLNVSAMKPNFGEDYNSSVVVDMGNNTTVELTLYEVWGVKVTPVHGAMDVPVDTTIVIMFEEEINRSTVSLETLALVDVGNNPIAGINESHYTWTDNKTCTITPPADLMDGTDYYVHIGEEVNTTNDEPAIHRMWHSMFTTKKGVGHVEGWVKDESDNYLSGVTVSIGSISDETNETGYFLLENVEVGEKDIMAELEHYEMKDGAVKVVVEAGQTVNITIILTKILPRIESKTPDNGDTDVPIDTNIEVVFLQAMNVSTITNATFLVNVKGGAAVEGTINVSNSDKTFTFEPAADLAKDTEYEVTLKKTIQVAGEDTDWFYEDIVYTFTTKADEIFVTVTFSPADGATGIALNAVVKLTFDYAMNRTPTQNAITAAFGTGFTWANDSKSVVINHDDFAFDTDYTVSISGNGLAELGYMTKAASATFTTEPKPTETETLTLKIKGEGKVTMKAEGNTYTATIKDNKAELVVPTDLPAGQYTVDVKGSGDYEDHSFKITKNADGSWSGDGIDKEIELEKKEAEPFNMLAILAIIIVVIIIIILLALAMKPKKPAEEEVIAEEEEELEEEEEEFECPECGAVVTAGETVCPECGAEFEEEEFECPECGASVESGVGTCPECGAEFEEEELEGEEEDEEFEVEDEEEAEAGEEDEDLDEELEDEDLEDEDLEEELEEEDEDFEEEDEDELEEEDEDLEEEDEDEELEDEEEKD